MRLFNSTTKTKEELIPRDGKTINMYVCGPTVYDYLHLGNFRGAIFFNALRNFLEKVEGYSVNFAYNYTDVDDKIIQKAKETNKSALEVSEFFIKEFEKDFNLLKLTPHTVNPKVSNYIPQMISYIEDIIKRNLAYEVRGSVYLRRHKLDDVGMLSGRNIHEGQSSDKNDLDGKEHAADFALWKSAKEGEISWPSPWGEGRPGWHLECSVMIHDIFKGKPLDIHGGGIDLLFPHHENECYQCKAHGEELLASHWVHNNMLNYDGQKMSKSLGNVLTGRSFIEQHSGELLKFIMLNHQYRSIIDFGTESVKNQRNQLAKIYTALKKAQGKGTLNNQFKDLKDKSIISLKDDFNTAELMSYVHEAVSRFYKNESNGANLIDFINWIGPILSLFQEDVNNYCHYLDKQDLETMAIEEKEILELIEKRKQLRLEKKFKESDNIRLELNNRGINLLDLKNETTWEVIRTN